MSRPCPARTRSRRSIWGRNCPLPFEQIIGGPLQGVIRASAMAANETAQFINNVGFDAKNQARMVKFSYESAEHGEADQTTTPEKRVVTNVEVPLLAVVPIPICSSPR
ncbi:hypothetical protein C5L38_35335 (plasmid) [Streptomyces sp. WAC00288]|nr:hypothetical protein C5L38_35335 [Streptomyces sp. WAC00288]